MYVCVCVKFNQPSWNKATTLPTIICFYNFLQSEKNKKQLENRKQQTFEETNIQSVVDN